MMEVVPFIFIRFKPRIGISNCWRCLFEFLYEVLGEILLRPMNLTVLRPLTTVNFVKLMRSFHSNARQLLDIVNENYYAMKTETDMSKRCELQKEYYKEIGNYKGKGKYSDDYVKWLEDKVLKLQRECVGITNN